jgi:hypothetical protein
VNYDKIYTSIIQNRKSNPVTGYTENHHILPKCLFPQFENLREHKWNGVRLTAREHFVCHQLLIKIYPKNYKLICAGSWMSNNNRYNSKKYSWLKILFISTPQSKETRLKRSLSATGRKASEETKKKCLNHKKENIIENILKRQKEKFQKL